MEYRNLRKICLISLFIFLFFLNIFIICASLNIDFTGSLLPIFLVFALFAPLILFIFCLSIIILKSKHRITAKIASVFLKTIASLLTCALLFGISIGIFNYIALSNPIRPFVWSKNTGSAKQLIGKSVVIAIFISDKTSTFNDKEKSDVFVAFENNIGFLDDQASRYSANVTIEYGYDLIYSLSVSQDIHYDGIKDSPDDVWLSEIRPFCENKFKQTKENYKTDNIAFVFFVNRPDVSYAISTKKDVFNREYNDFEFAVVFTAHEFMSATIAHEILHLFGAIDLYNVTEKGQEIIDEKYTSDIMFDCSTIRDASIMQITAYTIGWLDKIDKGQQKIFTNNY